MEPPPGTTVRGAPNGGGQAVPGQQRPRTQAKKRARSATPRPPPEPEPAVVEKTPDAERVLVIGDFMANSLAKGLTETYADNPGVAVSDADSGSSGLVRRDRYDWATEVQGLVAEQNPAAVVVMIGSNDRQAIDSDTGSYAPGTDDWAKSYAGRITALAAALKATGKPVIWGSLVPVRSAAMSRDFSTINTVFHDSLEGTGITFVDLWNGFADEDGRFMQSGPDVTGQTTQLRSSDGINFTRAGQRKLAFFIQQELNDVLKNSVMIGIGAAGEGATPGAAGSGQSQIGPMVPLDALLSQSGELSTAATSGTGGGDVGAAVVQRLGAGANPPALRADSYSTN